MENNFLMDGSCLVAMQIYLHMEDKGAEQQFPYENQLYSLALTSWMTSLSKFIFLESSMGICVSVPERAYTNTH